MLKKQIQCPLGKLYYYFQYNVVFFVVTDCTYVCSKKDYTWENKIQVSIHCAYWFMSHSSQQWRCNQIASELGVKVCRTFARFCSLYFISGSTSSIIFLILDRSSFTGALVVEPEGGLAPVSLHLAFSGKSHLFIVMLQCVPTGHSRSKGLPPTHW